MLHPFKFGLVLLVVTLIVAGCGSSESKGFESFTVANVEPIASIPEREIYLYPEEDGVILRIGELYQRMDWIYSTPREIKPVVQVNDYNHDGKDEVAVILHIGSGSGVAVEELHIVELLDSDGTTDQSMIDYVYKSEDYMKKLREILEFKKVYKDGELFGQIMIGDQVYEVSMVDFEKEYGADNIHIELGFGSIVYFGIENEQLNFTAAVGFVIDGVAEPQYFGEITATVTYSSGVFNLDQYQFEVKNDGSKQY